MPSIAASSAAVDYVPSDLADLAGVYISTGKNFDGSTCEGVVEIVRHIDTFQLVWLIDAEPVALGVGIRTGNVLSVAYFADPVWSRIASKRAIDSSVRGPSSVQVVSSHQRR